jgi:hypothetical protein
MVNGLSMVWMMFQFQRLICLCHIKWLECNRNIIVAILKMVDSGNLQHKIGTRTDPKPLSLGVSIGTQTEPQNHWFRVLGRVEQKTYF